MLQSDKTAEQLSLGGVTTLLNDFPVLKLPLPQEFDFPALEWIKFACKRTISSHGNAMESVATQIQRSRYSFVPICNLGDDSTLSLIDTLLARQLTMGNQLVWYSDTD